MRMMLFMRETDMIMMVTNYGWSFHVEEVVASEETTGIEEAIEVTVGQVLLQDVLNTESW